MSGLAQLVPYFECQYPQVVPFSSADASAVINSQGSGMGDYIQGFGFPIPQYLSPGNMRGLGCADCGGSCNGLGQGSIMIGSTEVPLSAPGGLFSSGLDFTQWGLEEWGTVAVGLYVLKSLWADTKKQ